MEYVSQKALQKAEHIAERYKHQLDKVKEGAKKASAIGIKTGAAMGGAFGLAWWDGKNAALGTPEKSQVMGMDLSLLIGAAGLATEAMGWAGDEQTNEIAGSLGLGALCAFAAKKGLAKGQESAAAGK